MLFQQRFLQGIAEGRIRVAYRRWKRPTVRAGGTLRMAVGVLAIESVEPCEEPGVSEADARQAGHASREELAAELGFERAWLKLQIRKLKELGLTESLSPGYRLSPRGLRLLRS